MQGKSYTTYWTPRNDGITALKLYKEVTAEKLQYRQRPLKIIYNKEAHGIVEIDTRDKGMESLEKLAR